MGTRTTPSQAGRAARRARGGHSAHLPAPRARGAGAGVGSEEAAPTSTRRPESRRGRSPHDLLRPPRPCPGGRAAGPGLPSPAPPEVRAPAPGSAWASAGPSRRGRRKLSLPPRRRGQRRPPAPAPPGALPRSWRAGRRRGARAGPTRPGGDTESSPPASRPRPDTRGGRAGTAGTRGPADTRAAVPTHCPPPGPSPATRRGRPGRPPGAPSARPGPTPARPAAGKVAPLLTGCPGARPAAGHRRAPPPAPPPPAPPRGRRSRAGRPGRGRRARAPLRGRAAAAQHEWGAERRADADRPRSRRPRSRAPRACAARGRGRGGGRGRRRPPEGALSRAARRPGPPRAFKGRCSARLNWEVRGPGGASQEPMPGRPWARVLGAWPCLRESGLGAQTPFRKRKLRPEDGEPRARGHAEPWVPGPWPWSASADGWAPWR